MKRTLLIYLILIVGILKGQNNYSLGVNTSFLYNKITTGIEINKWHNNQHNKYTPVYIFRINYGLLGYKKYHIDSKDVIVKENSISILNSSSPPGGSNLSKGGGSVYKGYYYNSFEKVQLIGYEFSLTKEFKINDNFFFGAGIGWNYVKNNGYIIWYNPLINDKIQENTTWNFYTVSALSNFGYTKFISNHFIFKSTFNFYFFIPIKNGKQTFIFAPSMPNVGVEGDLSISLNYLF